MRAVAANYLAIPEAVNDNYNGFLFEAWNEKDCAEKALKLVGTKGLLRRFGENAIVTARSHSMKTVGDIWEKVFKEAIEKQNLSRA
jgi:glycosyltransferase involved in cell wall biosynthesis